MDPASLIASSVMQLRAVLHPEACWQDNLQDEDIATVRKAAGRLGGQLSIALREWSEEGSSELEPIERIHADIESLVDALGEHGLNHPVQRSLNISRVLKRMGQESTEVGEVLRADSPQIWL